MKPKAGSGLGWQAEHIQILPLLVVSLKTQLELQELTRPTAEQTTVTKF